MVHAQPPVNVIPDVPCHGDRQRLHIPVAGRVWSVERCSDMESLWEEMEQAVFDEDERLPYWAEVWPASLLVGGWLADHALEVAGKTCLDVGCGLGLTAMVASSVGARVVAFDYEPRAVAFARSNAVLNNVPLPLFLLMDWRVPALSAGAFELILAGDVLYEKRFFEPVERLFRVALAPGGRVLVGEPERAVSMPVWERMRSGGWRCEIVEKRKAALLGQNQTVRLWSLAREE